MKSLKKYGLELVEFRKTERKKMKFYHMMSQGFSGWYGTGYINLHHASEIIPIQVEAFMDDYGRCNYRATVLYPCTDQKKDFTFAYIWQLILDTKKTINSISVSQ